MNDGDDEHLCWSCTHHRHKRSQASPDQGNRLNGERASLARWQAGKESQTDGEQAAASVAMDETRPPRGWVSSHRKVVDWQAESVRQIDREAGRASREGHTPAVSDFIQRFVQPFLANLGGGLLIVQVMRWKVVEVAWIVVSQTPAQQRRRNDYTASYRSGAGT